MSLWRVGRESVRIGELVLTPLDRSVAATRAAEDGAGGLLGDIADTVVKWIPGEVLALYVAGVTMIGRPNWLWLAVGIGLAPAIVVVAAFANSGRFRPDSRTRVRAGLGFLAMVIWSLAVPASGWQAWGPVRDNAAAVALAAAAVGLLFGSVAEAASRWVDNRPPASARRGAGGTDAGRGARRPAQPGLDQPGSDPPGLDQPGLDPPGLDQPGLAPVAPERTTWAPAGSGVDAPTAEVPSRVSFDPQPLGMPSIPPLA